VLKITLLFFGRLFKIRLVIMSCSGTFLLGNLLIINIISGAILSWKRQRKRLLYENIHCRLCQGGVGSFFLNT